MVSKNKFYFSIIIPAHNEEKYIVDTIYALEILDYPKDKYEVLIVENGSTDKTFSLLKELEKDNIKAYTSEKSVSKARNAGFKKSSRNSDWIIFLDADTILKKNFLKLLNNYLQKNKDKNYVIGTTSILPFENQTTKAKIWFKFYDLGNKITKSSSSIQIIKREVANKISYDEELNLGEDLKYIKDARRYGNFFFFKNNEVSTSTRRYDKIGWFRIFLKCNLEALLPENLKKRKDYIVIR